MIYYAIRSYILFLSGYYVFLKIAKKANLIHSKHERLYILVITAVSSIILACTKQFFLSIHILSIQIISFITFKLLYKMKWSTAYIVTTIAYGIVHGLLFVSSVLVSAFLYIFIKQPPETVWIASMIKLTPVFLNALFLFLLFRIRRLHSGLPFLQELRVFDFSVVMSSVILMVSSLICITNNIFSIAVVYEFSATIFLFTMYLLWKKRIRAKYIWALKQQEAAATQEAIREQTAKLLTLTEENRKLSEIIHRDNKLIPAMELSVRTYLQSDGQDHMLGAQLLEQLSMLTAERKGILTQYEQDGETIQHTGCAAIDIVLDYMHQRAKQESVRFQTNCLDFQLAMKKQKIEESDIKTILADLIDNAIIACRDSAHKQVFVYIGTIRNRFIIRVFDSGIPFELETLRKIGIDTTTTHAETGGSGIGMQSLFALKREYASSILIQEHNQEQSLFTKDISVIFNRFNQFIIRSYRSDQIRGECSRSDMIVEAEDTAREQATLNVLSTQS